MTKTPPRHWHRLFGVTLLDYLTGSCYAVELEKDLSVRRQLLDVVIVKQTRGKRPRQLPTGLENLAKHNLLTFKSHQEPLDSWALQELIGHYVNYRKQLRTTGQKKKDNKLEPEQDFHLYAVCAHYPGQLATQVTWQPLCTGVYTATGLGKEIRVIVTHQTPPTPNNTLWHLFSGQADLFHAAHLQHQWRNPQISTIINQMYEYYQLEGVSMSYTMTDYLRDAEQFLVQQVKKYPAMLEKLSPEQRLQGLAPEQRLQGLAPEQRLHGLSIEEIETYLAKLKKPRSRQRKT